MYNLIMKIGIFGGSFDPVHTGHLDIAEKALKYVDKLIIIPNKLSPFKSKSFASPVHRFNMLRAAFNGIKNIEISDYEITKNDESFTVDTLRFFKNEGELYLIIGADSMLTLKSWKDASEIAKLARILIAGRAGISKDLLENCIGEWIVRYNGNVELIGEALDASSSDIRFDLSFERENKLLPKAVSEYIEKKRLYYEFYPYSRLFDKLGLSEKRKRHTVNAAKTAVNLAKRYGVNEDKAMIAAILHDIAKNLDAEECKKLGLSISNEILKMQPPVRHAFIGAEYVEKILKIDDEEIINAVKYHTTMRPYMSKLEQIIAIADYIEPERDFINIDSLRQAAFENLDRCTMLVLENTVDYLASSGKTIEELTLDALKFYRFKALNRMQ